VTAAKDLTTGSILKKLWIYFLPIAAGTWFQQLYNAVDAVIVGKFVGTQALAAVGGSAANIINVLIGFFVALSAGAGVVIAQLCGAKSEKELEEATGTSLVFSFLCGLVITVLFTLLAEDMLVFLKAPQDTLQDAALYLRIYFAGSAVVLLTNMESCILRAAGDSRSPFIYMLLSCVLNIALDLYFVIQLRLGVAGVALATIASQAFNFLLATVRLMRVKEAYRLRLSALRINRPLLRRMMSIGIPSGLQSSMYGISNVILQVAVNVLGTVVVASWSLSGKLDGFYWATCNAAGIAVTNFIGQNYGAGKHERVLESVRVSFKLFMGITVLMSSVILLFGHRALGIFTSDPDVISTTWFVVCMFVPFYFIWTGIELLTGILRGVGDAVVPTVVTGLGICLFRIVWVLTVFINIPTLTMVCLCYPVSWVVTLIPLWIYYRRGTWLHAADK